MSAAARAMLGKVHKLVPPMLERFHKGQLGRVAVIGGSADYTGAPYFSAMASARLGCDMSYVFCEPSAAPTIKSYSPNLMVSPILRSTASISQAQKEQEPSGEELAKPILDMLPRLHVLVIGPGLGRDIVTQKQVKAVIAAARKHNPPIPMVLDADALLLVQTDPGLIKGHKECILTPNVVEFGRLAKSVGMDQSGGDPEKACQELSKILGGVCIIQKGPVDYISQGIDTTVSEFQGGLKRSGGQGDTLTGSLGTLLAWREAYHEKLWDIGEEMSREETLLLAAFGGSAITRECSRRAFAKRQRSLQASDLTDEVHESFLTLIGEPGPVHPPKQNL
ncbi:YjeF family domain-containing protein [Cladophialophora bantiana CBS 173.52]|uniref:ATP-dependent (S)-NAD(P)H-hydrate dehydratase n=1 Tax=Cladophialophora bantiana (strain ATCC 10958 / CBS 173.52 / CDC B-1940 / NIH 8579) TaxID=1442370 RepID=A0A0D2HFN9_CLAB1|nr:YjeF family domain-containing protein [Cladophialophora bantiana CBS 173.52]KIW92058.1 YjeF family domain-containing protein [Cladophialophora bantiana CBS 173.52]